MRTTVEVIGPEQATKYLARNENNRPLRRATVIRYAEMMRRGQWKLTHEAVAFDTNGELKNGQHRLAAVIESGATVQMTVTRGIDPSTFEVIDSGVKRSIGDRLHQMGTPYYTFGAVALRYILLYKSVPDLRWVGRDVQSLVNDQDIMRAAESFGDDLLLEAGNAAMKAGAPDVGVSRTAAMAAYILFTEADPERAKLPDFWDGLVTGAGLARYDSRLTLRRWSANLGRVPYKGQKALVGLIKAWNAFSRDEELRQIKWLPGERMPDICPITAVKKAAVAR